MKRYTRGFTLIELLVVIAIIGILASVVLVSLQSARKKGTDSRVISDVQQMRTEAEAKYDGVNYVTFSSANTATAHTNGIVAGTVTTALLQDVASSQTGGTMYAYTNAGPTAYAIYGRLVSDPTKYFCIDSTGQAKQSVTPTAAVTCP